MELDVHQSGQRHPGEDLRHTVDRHRVKCSLINQSQMSLALRDQHPLVGEQGQSPGTPQTICDHPDANTLSLGRVVLDRLDRQRHRRNTGCRERTRGRILACTRQGWH